MRRLIWLWLGLALTGLARAETINLTMPNGLVARAEYRPGQPDRPAVLMLHGFLQTHDFPTVYHLREELASHGYTVLAPTLTLGIPHRRQSLACEAMHGHTLGGDLMEIDRWVHWLGRRGHAAIVLIGHSTGSTELLAYLDRGRYPPIKQFIGISLVDGRVEINSKTVKRLRHALRQGSGDQHRQPIVERLSYCRQYRATPESYLSYAEWGPDRILAAVGRLTVPAAFVMGGGDNRLGPGWVEQLGKRGKPMRVIQGANHFLDGEHEFDLLDAVTDLLQQG